MRHPHKQKKEVKKTQILFSIEERIEFLQQCWPTLYYNRHNLLQTWFFCTYRQDDFWVDGCLTFPDEPIFFYTNEKKRYIKEQLENHLKWTMSSIRDSINNLEGRDYLRYDEPLRTKIQKIQANQLENQKKKLEELTIRIQESNYLETAKWLLESEKSNDTSSKMYEYKKKLNGGVEPNPESLDFLGFPNSLYINTTKCAASTLPVDLNPEWLNLLKENIEYIDKNVRYIRELELYTKIKTDVFSR